MPTSGACRPRVHPSECLAPGQPQRTSLSSFYMSNFNCGCRWWAGVRLLSPPGTVLPPQPGRCGVLRAWRGLCAYPPPRARTGLEGLLTLDRVKTLTLARRVQAASIPARMDPLAALRGRGCTRPFVPGGARGRRAPKPPAGHVAPCETPPVGHIAPCGASERQAPVISWTSCVHTAPGGVKLPVGSRGMVGGPCLLRSMGGPCLQRPKGARECLVAVVSKPL